MWLHDCDLEIVDFSQLMSKRRSDEIIVGMPTFEPMLAKPFLYRIRRLYTRAPTLHEKILSTRNLTPEEVKPVSPYWTHFGKLFQAAPVKSHVTLFPINEVMKPP